MDQTIISFINELYPLTKCDIKEFNKIEFNGMSFTNTHYEAEGLGSVSIMEMVAAGGAMTMDSIIINPFNIDAPLVSYDRVKAFGKDTLLLESYNTCLNNDFDQSNLLLLKSKYSNFIDHVSKPCWYDDITMPFSLCKDGEKSNESDFDNIAKEFILLYLEATKIAPKCDEKLKRLAAKKYSDGLLEHGGPATDPFKAAVGIEKTTEFFNKVLFAVEK